MSEIPTLGVEEELALVERRSGLLRGCAARVLDVLPGDVKPFVDHELKRCQIETMSAVHRDLGELRDDLAHLRTAVGDAARLVGCKALATGTHPSDTWRDHPLTAKAAYEELERNYRRFADEQLVFGCHVHVGIDDPDLRIAVLDRVRPWLAVLLALSANSPCWEGEDTGYASYRYTLFSRWPTFQTPEALGSWDGFRAVVDDLLAAGAIDSPQRLYWTIRPSARYPTLEFRIADVCPTVDEAAMVAGLARALVMTAVAEIEAGAAPIEVRTDALRMAEWQAARHGLSGPLMDPVHAAPRTARGAVAQLLDHVGAALDRAGDGPFVREVVDRVLVEGNGADRQRRSQPVAPPAPAVLSPLATGTAATAS